MATGWVAISDLTDPGTSRAPQLPTRLRGWGNLTSQDDGLCLHPTQPRLIAGRAGVTCDYPPQSLVW